MRLLRFTTSGGGAAGILALAEVLWMAWRVPRAFEPAGGAVATLLAILPRALLVGAVLALIEALVLSAANVTATWCARWRGSQEVWTASLMSALVAASLGACAYLLLGGRHVRAAGGRGLIVAVIVPSAAWLAYESVRSGRRLSAWLQDQSIDRRRRLAVRWATAGASLCVGLGFFLTDRTVLVRLYEPFHLTLRVGMFLSVQVGLLAARAPLRAEPPASRRSARRAMAATLAATAVVLALELSCRRDGAYGAALGAMRLHGAVGSILVSAPDALATKRRDQSGRQILVGVEAAAAAREPILPGANLLLITVDALRADHLGSYGYARATSPSIDRLARGGVVFERAYTSAPHTSYALASILTGQPAMSLSELGTLDRTTTVAELARAGGYHTAAFFPPAVFFVDEQRFTSFRERAFGFETVFSEDLPEASSAPLLTDKVLAFLGRQAPSRFLLWVHYFGPHEPYVDHPEIGPPFGATALDRYDGEIRWTDREIGRLVDSVRADYPSTVVILTADHGEEFGEHGGAYHGTTLHDEQVRVPLIISMPDGEATRVRAPVSTTSIVPTVVDVVGMSAEVAFDGPNLRPWLVGAGTDAGRNAGDAFSENPGQRMMVSGAEKLICDTRTDRCALFDLDLDPGEVVDLSSVRTARVLQMKEQLDAWDFRQEQSSGRPDVLAVLADPGATPMVRRSAARSVARISHAARAPRVRAQLLRERDPVVKAWLAVALGQVGDTEARGLIPGLVKQSFDAGDELRAHAALARAAAGGGADLAPELAAALARVTDVNLRCALMHALSGTGTELAAETLMAEYDVIRSRICSAEALAGMRRASTVPFMLARLPREPYTTVQAALARALGLIGDASAVPALKALRDQTPESELARTIDTALSALKATPSGT